MFALGLAIAAILASALAVAEKQKAVGSISIALSLIGLAIAWNSIEVPSVTLSEYQRAREGANLAQVTAIFGAEGRHVGSSGTGDLSMEYYRWDNPDGSRAVLIFNRDKLVSKTQLKLSD